MKLKEKVQIKLNNSFEVASRTVEKLKSLGFRSGYNTSEKYWYTIFMNDRMNLIIFESGNMQFSNHIASFCKVYDSLDEFLNIFIREKQTRTISATMSKEAVDYIEDLAKKESKGMWSVLEEIILNHKRDGLR